MQTEKKDKPQQETNRLSLLGRYSSMGFQMFAIIGLAAWGGIKIDQWVKWRFPVFTFFLTIAGVILSLVYFIRESNQLNRKK